MSRYRERELGCESTINRLLQAVVERASRANRAKTIRNPAAYLASAYQHAVDKFLDREEHYIPMDDAALDTLQPEHGRSWEEEIHRRLDWEKIWNAMDHQTRQVASWRAAGYSMKEIGRALSKDPRLAYVRFRRGVQRAVRKAFGGSDPA